MKVYLYISLFLLLGLSTKAQQNYFVYVQADNKQPFYIRMSDKELSSSASGYMVIPKLSAGKYVLTVGFPKDIFPEQTLSLTVGKADAGYLLKNFGDKGWGLYNIQTMELTMNGGAPVKQKPADGDDVFANALAGASNTYPGNPPTPDPKPAEQPIQPAEAPKAVLPEAPKAVLPETPKAVLPEAPKTVLPAAGPSVIQKLGSADAAEGRAVLYTDRNGTTVDTIRIFIPTEPVPALKTPPAENAAVKPAPVKDSKFLNIELPNPNAKATDKPVVAFNSDCRSNAGNADFLKIRKNMAAAANDEDMIDAAKKLFKLKCYSTEQVKNLSGLFLNDAGKYNFFDAAYPHTSDTQNFGSLQSELHEEYYVNRFRAMLRN